MRCLKIGGLIKCKCVCVCMCTCMNGCLYISLISIFFALFHFQNIKAQKIKITHSQKEIITLSNDQTLPVSPFCFRYFVYINKIEYDKQNSSSLCFSLPSSIPFSLSQGWVAIIMCLEDTTSVHIFVF